MPGQSPGRTVPRRGSFLDQVSGAVKSHAVLLAKVRVARARDGDQQEQQRALVEAHVINGAA